jgi:hypothetical protein
MGAMSGEARTVDDGAFGVVAGSSIGELKIVELATGE